MIINLRLSLSLIIIKNKDMAKLEHFRDLFKYASELFDDDYNKNKALVVKVKSKSVDGLTVSNARFLISTEQIKLSY